MPFKDKATRNKANHISAAKRRLRRITDATALLGGKCVKCGETEDLDFDHVDPNTRLFTISDGARKANEIDFWREVAKCQLLCRPCHLEKSKTDGSMEKRLRGENHVKAKLRELDVRYIRELYAMGYTPKAISEEFNVVPSTISNIVSRRIWKSV